LQKAGVDKKSIETFLLANRTALSGDIPLQQKKDMFMKAVKEDSKNYLAVAALGKVAFAQDERSTAISYYKKSIEINPKFRKGYENLIRRYRDYEDYENLKITAEQLIKLYPENPVSYDGLYHYFKYKKNYKKAIEAGKKAIELYKNEFPNLDFQILRVGGTDDENIKNLIDTIALKDEQKIIVLVDRDDAGYKVYKKIFSNSSRERKDVLTEKYRDNIHFLMLPCKDNNNDKNFVIEDYFTKDDIEKFSMEYLQEFLGKTSESFGSFPKIGEKLKKENIDILKKTGIVVFLDRTIDAISKENHKNRPLLQNPDNLQKLYDERIKLYRRYADIIIKNDDSIDIIVDRIITSLKGKIL